MTLLCFLLAFAELSPPTHVAFWFGLESIGFHRVPTVRQDHVVVVVESQTGCIGVFR